MSESRANQDFNERLEQVRTRKQQRAGRTAPGCLAPFLAILIAALGLALIAAFLPPLADYNPVVQALDEDRNPFTRLHSGARLYEKAGLRLEVLPHDPGDELDVLVEWATSENYLKGEVAAERWTCPDQAILPRYATLQGNVYSLTTQGTLPTRIGLGLAASADVDLYGWYAHLGRWQFIPAQMNAGGNALVTDVGVLPDCVALFEVAAPVPVISLSLRPGEVLTTTGNVDRIYVRGMQPTSEGTLLGALPDGVTADQGYSLFPVISNMVDWGVVDQATITAVLQNPETRTRHIAHLTAFAQPYAGLVIDYQSLDSALQPQFSAFIQALASSLHTQSKLLIVIVPAAEYGELGWSTGAYAWRTLGQFADELVIRAPLDPAAFMADGLFPAMLKWAVGEVNRYHLSVAFSTLSVQIAPESPASLLAFDLDSVPADQAMLDEATQTQFIAQGASTLWLTTPESLLFRLTQLRTDRLGGLLLEDSASSPLETPRLLQTYLNTQEE